MHRVEMRLVKLKMNSTDALSHLARLQTANVPAYFNWRTIPE